MTRKKNIQCREITIKYMIGSQTTEAKHEYALIDSNEDFVEITTSQRVTYTYNIRYIVYMKTILE